MCVCFEPASRLRRFLVGGSGLMSSMHLVRRQISPEGPGQHQPPGDSRAGGGGAREDDGVGVRVGLSVCVCRGRGGVKGCSCQSHG